MRTPGAFSPILAVLRSTSSTTFASSTSTTSSSARSWACAQCRRTQLAVRHNTGVRFASSSSSTPHPHPRTKSSHSSSSSSNSSQWSQSSNRRRRAIILTASGGAVATASALAFTDDIRASYETVERSGRVATALVLCISDYRTTLNKREKITDAKEKSDLLKACHKRCALRTYKVLERNGGIFIKLGQHLSAMNYLLPPEWTTTFIPLQDQCPVSSFASVQEMYRRDTGHDLWDDFSEFAEEPIGAASLAQVHLATIRATGQKVAVKVQHPVLAQWAPLDMALTSYTFSTLKRFFPEYDLEWLSSEMSSSLPQELDFEREAANARRTEEYFAAHQPHLPLVIPDVLWARPRLLVMACEAGHRLDDLAYLDAHGIDRDAVAANLAHVFNEMIFGKDAPLHCDPHGGNLAIRARPDHNSWWQRWILGRSNYDIILYDHGLYRDIPQTVRRSYAKMWLAVLDGDMDRMQQYAQEVAGIEKDDFPLFASAITGREFKVLQSASVMAPRTDDERESMGNSLQEGLLTDLVQLLGKVPRIILLILKTNDLTRSLDENLHTRQGPVQAFLIMAHYCLRTVREEQIEELGSGWTTLLWPGHALRWAGAWLGYLQGTVKLDVFSLWLTTRRLLGQPTNLALGM